MKLSHSRMPFVRVYFRETQELVFDVRNSDDSDQPFQRIPISHSDRSRSDWRECAVGCIC
jgi:hypothetical protein